jgi:hypothetical protein
MYKKYTGVLKIKNIHLIMEIENKTQIQIITDNAQQDKTYQFYEPEWMRILKILLKENSQLNENQTRVHSSNMLINSEEH